MENVPYLDHHSPIDWNEAYRVAACSKYNCVPEFDAVKAEVEAELEKSKS